MSDLACPAEPPVPLALGEASGLAFDAGVRAAGQACRDALARVCRWHRALGLEMECGQ